MKEELLAKIDTSEVKAKKVFQEAIQGQNKHQSKFMT
jgi:hypothetical protein